MTEEETVQAMEAEAMAAEAMVMAMEVADKVRMHLEFHCLYMENDFYLVGDIALMGSYLCRSRGRSYHHILSQ